MQLVAGTQPVTPTVKPGDRYILYSHRGPRHVVLDIVTITRVTKTLALWGKEGAFEREKISRVKAATATELRRAEEELAQQQEEKQKLNKEREAWRETAAAAVLARRRELIDEMAHVFTVGLPLTETEYNDANDVIDKIASAANMDEI